MATGGTIPSNRQQTVTFYNTTGIIDKEKNIYLAPRFSKVTGLVAGTEVRSAFLSVFNGVCPPSSQYTGIEISGWSPEDRTLKVKGNIDDFRLVTEEGVCLNYFIVSRTVTKGEGQQAVTKTFYYGFFITGVQQAGGGSVLLTVQPDDLTNVFYLHNTHQLTALEISNDYEPFNSKMKNCYVNRQHYNRVNYITRTITHTDHYEGNVTSIGEVSSGQSTSMNVILSHEGTLINESHYGVTPDNVTVTNVQYQLILDMPNVIYTAYFTSAEFGFTSRITIHYSFDIVWEEEITQLEPVNMKIFLNQEETYRFKYQYRDFKKPLNQFINFSQQDYQDIENASSLSDLSLTLRKKVIVDSLMYLVVETRGVEVMSIYSSNNHNSTWRQGNKIRGLKRPNVLISFPIVDTSRYPKFEEELNKIDFFFSLVGFSTETGNYDIAKGNNVYVSLNKQAIADYVMGAYVIRDVLINPDIISISATTGVDAHYVVTYDLEVPNGAWTNGFVGLDKGYYLGGITTDKSEVSVITKETEGVTYISTLYCNAGIIVSGYNSKEINFTLEDSLPNLKTNYYDNVLECEPYTFYSVSFNSSFEFTLNKNRYYKYIDSEVTIKYFVSINGAVKIGLIPYYEVEDYRTNYYNEGLVFTLSSFLPLISDSYMTYYYQNQAQMKNQYAVAEYQWATDFAQKFFLSSPNQVGQRAFKGGGYGALAGTINEVVGWADDAIDYAQNKHVIGMNQQAKLADMGAKPDALKQSGSDVFYDVETNEYDTFINHYTIDAVSYNSIAKMLERIGYQINLYDSLHTMDRVGWNFIKLNTFDFVANITVAQEGSIRKIFTEGVTLLHDKSYLTAGHNFETILEGGD